VDNFNFERFGLQFCFCWLVEQGIYCSLVKSWWLIQSSCFCSLEGRCWVTNWAS